MNIPLFEWDVLAGYILFVDGEDLARVGRWVRGVAASTRRPARVAADF